MKANNVVITRMAALAPIGVGVQAFVQGLQRSESRLGPTTLFGEEPLYGGELWDFDPKAILGKKGLRNFDRNTRILLSCLQLDLGDLLAELKGEEVGLCVGTTFGSFASQVDFTSTYIREGYNALNPMLFPNMVINSPPSQGNIRFGLTSSSTTISNGFTSGLDALVFGADQIRNGYTPALLCGGSEELSFHLHHGYVSNHFISPSNEVRPFGAERDGFLLGEGAALMLLEEGEYARARGATPLATVVAYTNLFDGTYDNEFHPQAEGLCYALEETLRQAGISPEQVGLISANANGSVVGDRIEALALRQVFGDALEQIPVVAYKGYWGECLGAAGALQVAATVADLSQGRVSLTPNARPYDSDFALWLPEEPLQQDIEFALVLSCGPNGSNTVLLLQHPQATA